jgi:hypothetical protein
MAAHTARHTRTIMRKAAPEIAVSERGCTDGGDTGHTLISFYITNDEFAR